MQIVLATYVREYAVCERVGNIHAWMTSFNEREQIELSRHEFGYNNDYRPLPYNGEL